LRRFAAVFFFSFLLLVGQAEKKKEKLHGVLLRGLPLFAQGFVFDEFAYYLPVPILGKPQLFDLAQTLSLPARELSKKLLSHDVGEDLKHFFFLFKVNILVPLFCTAAY
jgi:hypothetical protein